MSLDKFEYLIVLILVISVPLILSFHPATFIRGEIWLTVKTIILVAIPWLIWDIWATSRGHWAFNNQYILGTKILNLPVEEILFFGVIPYSCIFVWTIFRDFTTWKDFKSRLANQRTL